MTDPETGKPITGERVPKVTASPAKKNTQVKESKFLQKIEEYL